MDLVVPPARLSLREAQRAVTRGRICNAASELFFNRGFSAVTMEDIAQAAGVSRSTLYVHYPDKADLSAEIASGYGDILCALIAQLPGPVPTRSQIDQWLVALVALMDQEHIPATLISDMNARGETPAVTQAIGERLLLALSAQLPSLQRTLGNSKLHSRARAWAETAMREVGWACLQTSGDLDDAGAARLHVAADIFERFVHAQSEMEE